MARPPLPTVAANAEIARKSSPGFVEDTWATTINAAIADTSDRADNAPQGGVLVDSFTGANDDAKLAAALTYSAAQTYPPVIRFTNRNYALNTGGLTPFAGMTLWGPEGYNNPERSYTMGTRLTLGMTGGWFVNSANTDTFSVSMGQLSFVGTGTNASVLTQTGTGSMYCLLMRDISSAGLRTVLGTQAQKLLITAASFDGGAWEINNCYNGAFHLGGSDNTLWPDGCLLDSAPAYNTAGSAAGQFHLWCDALDKTYIGPMYVTCNGNWGGIKVTGLAYNTTGSTNCGVVNFHGLRIEGMNPTTPCNGSLIRVEGGVATFNDVWFAYGMASPTSMGHTPADAGIIHQSASSRVTVIGGSYDRTSGQAETVPFGYSAAGQFRVRDLAVAARGGTWTGLPRVQGAGGTVTLDDTATLI